MKTTLFLSIILASAALVPSASALTITNRDADERQIMITEDGDEQIFILAPNEALTDICNTGCIIAPEEQDGVEVDGEGAVAIIDGQIVRE